MILLVCEYASDDTASVNLAKRGALCYRDEATYRQQSTRYDDATNEEVDEMHHHLNLLNSMALSWQSE